MTGRTCPGCGAGISFPGKGFPVVACGSCRTLLFDDEGGAVAARPFDGRDSAPAGRTVALVCRLCGGPFPREVLTSEARCSYCGHPALLPPRLRDALRLLARPNAVLPPGLRTLRTGWLCVLTLFLSACLLEARWPYRGVLLDVSRPLLARTSADDGAGAAASDPPPVTFRVVARGAVRPYAQVAAQGDFRGTLVMRLTLTEERTGVSRGHWIELTGDGPGKRTIAELFVSRGLRTPLVLPAGRYRLDGTAISSTGTLPAALKLSFRTAEQPPTGVLILVANLLVWLFVLELRASVGQLGLVSAKSGAVLVIALLLTAACLFEVVVGSHPFGPRAAFPAAEAGPPPPAGTPSG